MTDFTREERYLVFKLSDIEKIKQRYGPHTAILDGLYSACSIVDSIRRAEGKDILKCAVIEEDWPEYELVWKIVEQRVTGT